MTEFPLISYESSVLDIAIASRDVWLVTAMSETPWKKTKNSYYAGCPCCSALSCYDCVRHFKRIWVMGRITSYDWNTCTGKSSPFDEWCMSGHYYPMKTRRLAWRIVHAFQSEIDRHLFNARDEYDH